MKSVKRHCIPPEYSPAMATSRPYIGCKIHLISKAQHRYEGILYTIDKKNSTVVLAKVKCFGTEQRPTDRPVPPREDLFEFITFRGSNIKDVTLCEPPKYDLPQDPAIVPSASTSSSGVNPGLQSFDSMGMSAYNQLTSSLLGQQYAAALGLVPGLHVRRAPTVEKAVQTLHVERSQQRRRFAGLQEQRFDRRRPRGGSSQARGDGRATASVRSGSVAVTSWQDGENRPPPTRKGTRRRRNRSRGQLMVANVPPPTLKFDTDFDFASSNAKFIKEEIEREMDRMMIKDGNYDEEKENEGLRLTAEDYHFGPKFYYDKSKSFFDKVSSDSSSSGVKLTWAEERKRNLETFGVAGRFRRGPTFRGVPGNAGRRGQGSALPAPTTRTVQ